MLYVQYSTPNLIIIQEKLRKIINFTKRLNLTFTKISYDL